MSLSAHQLRSSIGDQGGYPERNPQRIAKLTRHRIDGTSFAALELSQSKPVSACKRTQNSVSDITNLIPTNCLPVAGWPHQFATDQPGDYCDLAAGARRKAVSRGEIQEIEFFSNADDTELLMEALLLGGNRERCLREFTGELRGLLPETNVVPSFLRPVAAKRRLEGIAVRSPFLEFSI